MDEQGLRKYVVIAVVGSISAAVFKAYVERVLAPSLRPGQVVVMDNLSVYKGYRTGPTSRASRPGTLLSGWGFTDAWARSWPVQRARCCSRSSHAR